MEKLRVELYNIDNMEFEANPADLIFCDYVYENLDFSWAEKYFHFLKPNGIMISMTDFHSNHRYRIFMEDKLKAIFVNELVWKNEWGNYKKDRFNQCYDSIIIYSNGKNWNFYPDRIQVPKVTNSKGLNPSGRKTKPATAWIDDVTLTTVAKERVKKKDGHLIKWQKPLRLYDRIIMPFTNEKDSILDPFMGSGSLGKWCMENNRNYTGIENDRTTFKLATKNIFHT